MILSDKQAMSERLARDVVGLKASGSWTLMVTRTRKRSAGAVASFCCALVLLLSGCGSIWSPSPPPPTSEQIDQLRRDMAARRRMIPRTDQTAEQDDRLGHTAVAPVPPPLPDLPPLQAYPNWSMQDTAADSLGRIGAPAVPELIRTLSNPDPQLRRRAASVLGRIGPDAALAVPELIRLLDDPNPDVRHAAARTLGQIGPSAASAVPALVDRLKTEG
jgi:hypothetical protein